MPAIINRLTRQLAARGVKDANTVAVEQLRKSGILDNTGKLTDYGKERNAMTPSQRAKDRAAKYSGSRSPDDYKYSPKTNRATLKK